MNSPGFARLFGLSQAAMVGSCNSTVPRLSAGGMLPMGSSSRRLLKLIDPGPGRELDGLEASPRPAPMNDLGFVEAIDRLATALS
jgi:hypothetical protein